MKRRNFIKMCSSALALVYASPKVLAQGLGGAQLYDRVLLTDKNGKPLKASSLKKTTPYVFHYPFAGTPCFLIDLGKKLEAAKIAGTKSQESTFDWPGGVGKNQSIVAFSAVCSHLFSYPSKKRSFINFQNGKSNIAGTSMMITCCAHQSVFDPAQGAKVVAGPATRPLTTIVLEYDIATDRIYAMGVIGKEYYRDFFRAYKRELNEEYGRGTPKQTVQGKSEVVLMTEFSEKQFKC